MVGYSPMQTYRFMPDETTLDIGFSRSVEETQIVWYVLYLEIIQSF